MCIIVYAKPGVSLPGYETLNRCWVKNDDGAGILEMHQAHCVIRKGFMNFRDLWNSLWARRTRYAKISVAIHFRLGTSGGKTNAQTHPFPLTDDWEKMKKNYFVTDRAVMHNGIVGTGKDGHSDTMIFARNILNRMGDGLVQKSTLKTIEELTSGSKFLIYYKGMVYLTGDWESDKDGVWYSNGGYKKNWYVRGRNSIDWDGWGGDYHSYNNGWDWDKELGCWVWVGKNSKGEKEVVDTADTYQEMQKKIKEQKKQTETIEAISKSLDNESTSGDLKLLENNNYRKSSIYCCPSCYSPVYFNKNTWYYVCGNCKVEFWVYDNPLQDDNDEIEEHMEQEGFNRK